MEFGIKYRVCLFNYTSTDSDILPIAVFLLHFFITIKLVLSSTCCNWNLYLYGDISCIYSVIQFESTFSTKSTFFYFFFTYLEVNC